MKKRALGTGFDTLAVRHGSFNEDEEKFIAESDDHELAFNICLENHLNIEIQRDKINGVYDK